MDALPHFGSAFFSGRGARKMTNKDVWRRRYDRNEDEWRRPGN
jgi:hypothetical protein